MKAYDRMNGEPAAAPTHCRGGGFMVRDAPGVFMLLVGCLLVLLPALSPAAEPAGETIFARGAVTAQSATGQLRVIGKDAPLFQGDTITTGPKSFAVLRLGDGSRISLRPGTSFRLDRFNAEAGKESALLHLIKGGLRAITGFISKRRTDAFKVTTAVATIGIRGTEFDARLCGDDCAKEAKDGAGQTQVHSPVIGRVVLLKGELEASGYAEKKRHMTQGAPVYEGDRLFTGHDAHAVIAFRDRGRITLLQDSEFRVEKFRYTRDRPDEGNALFRLVKGGIRALTGLIGRRRHRNYAIATPVGTIGIRGTGFDLIAQGDCLGRSGADRDEAGQGGGDCLLAHVWQGRIVAQQAGRETDIDTGETWHFAAPGSTPSKLAEPPPLLRDIDAPRPDEVPVDQNWLFGAEARKGTPPGLYVSVADGHVSIEAGGKTLDLGVGEAGYAAPDGTGLARLDRIPAFQEQDPYLRTINPDFEPLYDLLGNSPQQQFECLIQ